jgi:hypothetical protein
METMRKLMMLITLAVTYVVFSGAAGAWPPPTCDPNCPWIR